jgi:hypothetical protein
VIAFGTAPRMLATLSGEIEENRDDGHSDQE